MAAEVYEGHNVDVLLDHTGSQLILFQSGLSNSLQKQTFNLWIWNMMYLGLDGLGPGM